MNREYQRLTKAKEGWQRRNLSRGLAIVVGVYSLIVLILEYTR